MIEIRPDDAGAIDEVVSRDVLTFHLERLNDSSWYLILETLGEHLHLQIFKKGKEVVVQEYERYPLCLVRHVETGNSYPQCKQYPSCPCGGPQGDEHGSHG